MERKALIINASDDEALRHLTASTLRQAGFEVLDATSGKEALTLAEEGPDLIVLDVQMPDMSGLEVSRRIKSNPKTASVLVLSLSLGTGGAALPVQGQESGADGYLIHPVEPAELTATVRALLRLRRAEDLARTSSQQWQGMFEVLSEGVALLDARGRVTRHNAAFLRLLERSETLPEEPQIESLFEAAAIGGVFPASLGNVGSRGVLEMQLGRRWLRVSMFPLEHGGAVHGAVRVLTDLTGHQRGEIELRRRADALLLADRRKDEYLSMLAHELRNPLAALTTGLQLLEGAAVKSKVVETVQRQARHLARIVDDLFDLNRLTYGLLELRREPLDLRELVQRVVASREPLLAAREITILAKLSPVPLLMDADGMRLEQVIDNLLENAGKFSEPGAVVHVVLWGHGAEATLEVRDTGAGIAPEVLPSVFELLAQADRSSDRSRGGLGIGLTLVKQIIELHQGRATARSEGLGRGATFEVTLPLREPVQEPLRAAVETASERPPPGLHVLLVEDNEDAREMMKELLQLWGHRVDTAADGAEGLDRALELTPEVCLLDVGLPKMDGYELARRIRASSHGQEFYLVALTGYGGVEQKTLAKQAGFDLHLVKPVDPAALETLLRDFRRPTVP